MDSTVKPSSKKSLSKMVDAMTITASIFGVGTSITRPKLDHNTKPYAISSVKYLLST